MKRAEGLLGKLTCMWDGGVDKRGSTDGFDRPTEHDENNETWIKDDHREQPCWKVEEQRDR